MTKMMSHGGCSIVTLANCHIVTFLHHISGLSHYLSPMLRSRIAPAPSGYLHFGNAASFVLTWLFVRLANGSLRLRIDDQDTTLPAAVPNTSTIFLKRWIGWALPAMRARKLPMIIQSILPGTTTPIVTMCC